MAKNTPKSRIRAATCLAPWALALTLPHTQAALASEDATASTGETTTVHRVIHSIAKSKHYSASDSGSGYKWNKSSMADPASNRLSTDRRLSGGYKWGKSKSAIDSSVSTKAEQAGKRWGRAATSEQTGKRWGRAETSEQAGKRWGRAETSEQAGKRWGRAETSEQAGKRWGRAETSEQAGKRWGRAETSEQAGKRWGRAETAEQAGKRWGRG